MKRFTCTSPLGRWGAIITSICIASSVGMIVVASQQPARGFSKFTPIKHKH